MRDFGLIYSLVFVISLSGGCASKPPDAISKVPAENPTLTRVLLDLDRFVGSAVRWGGVISKVENRADQTWVEIVRHKLRHNGKPGTDGNSDGRFIASFTGFVDPLVYQVDRPLTVVGVIDGNIKRPIGAYDYTFPIVKVGGSYLWKAVTEVRVPYYPGPQWYYGFHFKFGHHHRHRRHH